ncbi:MAG TPA: hypothetical protein VFL82_14915 [Thermomicrobiales bacterium]|nr:hypothetical protein [Thermomicrobiales bacterium]
MAASVRVQAEEQFNRLRRGLAARLLGPGLLLVHIGIFLVAATALILINLYRHPAGLTVGGALRTWAAIVAFHALVVALYPVVRWSVATSDASGQDPMQRLREASTRLRTPMPRFLSEDGRTPLVTRVRENLTQPVSLDAFQGQSVQAIWQRVTVRWQRLTNEQVIPSSDMMNGNGQAYHNGHHATITAESGAYEVVTTSQVYGDPSSPASSWPQRNGTHATNETGGAPPSASPTRQVPWPQRPGSPVDPARAGASQGPAVPAEPIPAGGDGVGGDEPGEPPRWVRLEDAATSWFARPEQDQPEPQPHDGEQAPVSSDSPAPPTAE